MFTIVVLDEEGNDRYVTLPESWSEEVEKYWDRNIPLPHPSNCSILVLLRNVLPDLDHPVSRWNDEVDTKIDMFHYDGKSVVLKRPEESHLLAASIYERGEQQEDMSVILPKYDHGKAAYILTVLFVSEGEFGNFMEMIKNEKSSR